MGLSVVSKAVGSTLKAARSSIFYPIYRTKVRSASNQALTVLLAGSAGCNDRRSPERGAGGFLFFRLFQEAQWRKYNVLLRTQAFTLFTQGYGAPRPTRVR